MPATLAIALFTFAVACKKDDDSPAPSGGGGAGATEAPKVTFTINGDGFSNQAITINAASASGNAAYSVTDAETSGTVMADANNSFVLLFDGNSPATLTCAGGVGPVSFTLRTSGQLYISQNNTVVVTAYGAVGGFITGTFSGTVLRSNGPSAGTAATISNGTFRFRRVSDV
jgi:uncharacterized membrane-anchored protein YitT (DUF2179 family)